MSTIHLVSHTHWDREWYLTYQQFRLKLVHLVDTLLEILENDPDYHFFLLDGQVIILEDYLEIRPEQERKLRQYIQNGRIIIGPWYVSPDEFLISPESHIRNLLEGDRICRDFGTKMLVGYLPDTFGHIGQMPQILQGFGIDTTCLWRGLADQPVELTWKSPDGSSVLLSYLRESYSNAASLSTANSARFIREVNVLKETLAPYIQTNQVLLMHGTDHMEPSISLTPAILAFKKKSPKDEFIHSSLPAYFDAVHSQVKVMAINLPVVTGELRASKRSPILPNVLSTRIHLKQRNHACEIDLLKWVEPLNAWSRLLSSLNGVADKVYPASNSPVLTDQGSITRYAWKLLMQNHAHDSICGTAIDQVAREMLVRFDQVDQINHELITQNLERTSELIDTTITIRADQNNTSVLSTIIVFNPNDQPQSGYISLRLKLDPGYSSFDLIDDQNNSIPNPQKSIGLKKLISATFDKKELQQSMGMVHDGIVAGYVLREFSMETRGAITTIQATLSDHGQVDLSRWNQWQAELETTFADHDVKEYIVNAYYDPEVDFSFVAHDVPGHGYRCYWIHGKKQAQTILSAPKRLNPFLRAALPYINRLTRVSFLTRFLRRRQAKPNLETARIENEYYLVEANLPANSITVTDKRTLQVYAGMNQFIDSADCGDVYNYCPPSADLKVFGRTVKIDCDSDECCQKLTIVTEVCIPSSLSEDRNARSRSSISHPIMSTITLARGVPRVDIHTELENQAIDHRLRVHFPVPFPASSAFYDGHYELVKREVELPTFDASWVEPPRPEVPQRQFVMVTNNNSGLLIANRGLPEVEVLKNAHGKVEIAITLLRCVGWLSRDDLTTRKGHAGPMGVATPEAQMLGHHAFDYSIITGDENIIDKIHQAYAFNAPLRAVSASIHPGVLPNRQALLENTNPNFLVTAIKMSEDASQLVVRGYNHLATPIEVRIRPSFPFTSAQILNLAEQPIQPIAMAQDGSVGLEISGNKITTIGFLR